MANTILFHARLFTLDPLIPMAQAMAIRGNKIVAIGNDKEILKLADNKTQFVDAGNRLILPGFIDSHLHLEEASERLFHIKLREAKSREDFVMEFRNSLKNYKKGEWILGGDWNHENWGGELPDKNWIDDLTPENPVWVKRLDGHMALANSLAIEKCAVSSKTPVEGGEIVLKNGNITGIFKDRAMEIIEKNIPEISVEQKEQHILQGINYLSERGITSCHNLNLFKPIHISVFEKLKNQNKLNCRIYISFRLEDMDMLEQHIERNGKGDDWIRYGLMKAFIDGSLGSHTAAFFENYKGGTSNGILVTDPELLRNLIVKADSKGFQLAVHAIGNRANHLLISLLKEVEQLNGKRDRRFRIEHAQHVNKPDIEQIEKLNILVSAQPLHLYDDGRWAEKVLEKTALCCSYPFRDFIKNGTRISFGSDWFVAEPSALLGIHAAVNRHTSNGKYPNGWLPEQKISVIEAIKAYTIDAAYASFEEHIKGSLSPGKLADFVMLDQNILEIDPARIKDTCVLWTVVDGKTIYQKTN